MYTLTDAFELRPSRQLDAALGAGVVLALVALARAALPFTVQALLAAIVVAAAFAGWRRARRSTWLRIDSNGGLEIRDAAGGWAPVEVQASSLVAQYFMVLRYRTVARRVVTHVILPDSAPADAIRRLRVSLRWARHTRSDTAFPDAD